MRTAQILLVVLIVLIAAQPGLARHGHAATCCPQSTNHGQFNQISYGSYVRSNQKAILQTQTINQYTKLGYQFESKKKFSDAEQSYKYVLKIIALRDGPGSAANIPILDHLVIVTQAQNKLEDAIGYQDTSMRLKQTQPNVNKESVLKAQIALSDMLIKKQDYHNAELVLKQSVALYKEEPSLLPQKRQSTYEAYAKVLHQLNKDSEANTAELANNPSSSLPVGPNPASVQQIVIPQN